METLPSGWEDMLFRLPRPMRTARGVLKDGSRESSLDPPSVEFVGVAFMSTTGGGSASKAPVQSTPTPPAEPEQGWPDPDHAELLARHENAERAEGMIEVQVQWYRKTHRKDHMRLHWHKSKQPKPNNFPI